MVIALAFNTTHQLYLIVQSEEDLLMETDSCAPGNERQTTELPSTRDIIAINCLLEKIFLITLEQQGYNKIACLAACLPELAHDSHYGNSRIFTRLQTISRTIFDANVVLLIKSIINV